MAENQYTAKEIAAWFIEYNQQYVDNNDAELLSPMKVLKMLYYAQGAFLALDGMPLFKDEIQAWRNGPVVPSVYHAYKSYGAGGIDKPASRLPDLDPHAYAMLVAVYEKYAMFSANELSNMTHGEDPYITAYAKGQNTVIPQCLIKKYFMTSVYRKIIDDTIFDDIPIVTKLPAEWYDPADDDWEIPN